MQTGSGTIAPPRRIGASIGAVVAGFVTTVLISVAIDAILRATGIAPPQGVRMSDGLFLLALGYGGVADVAGGWVTARLSPSRPWRQVLILGALGVLAGLGSIAAATSHPEVMPLWYPIALVLLAVPCVALGGWLVARRVTA